MILSLALAASFTFTATATGVEKGTPIEFVFAGRNSDRDYETLFLVDESIAKICAGLDAAGLPRGRAYDPTACAVWPCGVAVTLAPALTNFLDSSTMPDTLRSDTIIYTGGLRNEKGGLVAENEMPAALFSLYTLDQAPFLLDGVLPQGDVYNHNLASQTLKKGQKYAFTIHWDDATHLTETNIVFTSCEQAAEALKALKAASEHANLTVQAAFGDELTLDEATRIAAALSVIDSRRLKVNGRRAGDFFYRAFLPALRWRERLQRLTQPFELTVTPNGEKIVYIDEDWSGEGSDPKLTEISISIEGAKKYAKTDTCFIYAPKSTKLKRLKPYLAKMPSTVRNWYLYGE